MAVGHSELREHVREHMEYPGTKQQLVERCEEMSDVPPEEKDWFIANLPEGTYDSAEDVLAALGL